jgi:hypothetical protein
MYENAGSETEDDTKKVPIFSGSSLGCNTSILGTDNSYYTPFPETSHTINGSTSLHPYETGQKSSRNWPVDRDTCVGHAWTRLITAHTETIPLIIFNRTHSETTRTRVIMSTNYSHKCITTLSPDGPEKNMQQQKNADFFHCIIIYGKNYTNQNTSFHVCNTD